MAMTKTAGAITPVLAIGPGQINHVDDKVTVTYPPGNEEGTVMSIQPDGSIETRPRGTAGPYECGLLLSDRVVFSPNGSNGPVFLLPYVDEIPFE